MASAREDSILDAVAAEFGLLRRTSFRRRARALEVLRAVSVDYLAAVA